MVRSTASRDRSDAGNRSASDAQPRPHASNSTTTSASPTAVCTPRSHGSSCSTLGAITRNKARASPSATRVHTTDDTAAPAGTPPRCTIRCTRAASPATATDRSFTAAPTRLASWATRQLWGATGFRMRCQPHPLATSDERFTANATTRSHRSAPSSAAKVTCHGKPVKNLSARPTPTRASSHPSHRPARDFTGPALRAGARYIPRTAHPR